ncbi:hypothetical protein RN001_008702 [Aquatica leii]|uniref:BEN domain-containing protein n=1 Tax=Aquatica leii TaxID=1421715 RepID=A0AAN7PDN6_9COLE|nr:hypothetical protein RN001_008702 [Aquatica leii]
MSASTILNLFACGVFRDDELVETYEDLCERIVLHNDVIEPEDEKIFEQFIQRVSDIKKTETLDLKMQPSTSKNSDLDTFVGGSVIIPKDFKHFNVISEGEKQIKKFKTLYNGEDIMKVVESKRIRVPTSRLMYDNNDDSEITEVEDISEIPVKNKKVKCKTNEAVTKNFNNLMHEIANGDSNDLKREIRVLQNENQKLKERENSLIKKNEELQELNVKLQINFLSNWEELLKSLKEKTAIIPEEVQPVGFRMDSKIHLGRNVWLPEQIYNSVDVQSKTNSAFVRGLACAMFGTTSSVTGQQCNRTKGDTLPALDATKLIAIHDIVQYRIIINGDSLEQAHTFCTTKVDAIVASKIADLKRGPRKIKKKAIGVIENENMAPAEDENELNLENEIALSHKILNES